ncbi:hypothetical protein MesoLj131a_10370 [Mesorhizobium sp. 131-2-1]|nr:hypothetical protein MesoLj131a_10370 [Mesorhizobium sp. 131-2-1]
MAEMGPEADRLVLGQGAKKRALGLRSHLGRIPCLQQLRNPTLRCITKAAALRHKRTLQVTKLDARLAKADTEQRKTGAPQWEGPTPTLR